MTTRVPLVTDSATFSARSRKQVTSKNETSSSPSCLRRFHASPKLATAMPPGVKRSSGSRVTFPTTVTVLSNAIRDLRSLAGRGRCGIPAEQAAAGRLVIGEPEDLVADGFVRETEEAIDLVEVGGLGDDLEHDVEALVLVVDLVGEPAHAPLVGGGDGASVGGGDLADPIDETSDDGFLELGVEDDHEFVRSHEERITSLWTRQRRGPARCGAGPSNGPGDATGSRAR